MKPRPSLARIHAAACTTALVVLTLDPTSAAVLFKDVTSTDLNAAASWSTTSGAATPDPASIGTADTLRFNESFAPTSGTSYTAALSANLTTGAIRSDFGSAGGGTAFGNVVISAGNTLTLNGNNDYTSGTAQGIVLNSATGGNLTIHAAVNLGASQQWVNSRTLTVGGAITLNDKTLSIWNAGSGTTTLGGTISGSGNLSFATSGGSSARTSVNGTLSGSFGLQHNANSGTLSVGGTTTSGYSGNIALGSASGGTFQVASGATLVTSGTFSHSWNKTLIFDGTLSTQAASISTNATTNMSGAGSFSNTGLYLSNNVVLNSTMTGTLDTTTGKLVIGASSTNASSAGTLTINGTGTVRTTGVQFGAAATTAAGTLTLGGNGKLLVGASGISDGSTGANTINVNLNNGTLGSLAAWSSTLPMTLGGTTLIDTAGGNISLGGALSGTGALTKTSSGRLDLTGTNTYTGATAVNAGTLNLTGSLAASSAVSIAAGATLTGSGSAGGNVTVAHTGTLIAGNGTSGTLTIGGNLTFGTTTGDTATIQIGSLANYTSTPAIQANGTLTLNGGAGSVTLNLGTAPVASGTYPLIGTTLNDASGFTLGTVPVLTSRQTGALSSTPTAIHYVISGANPVWTGAQGSEWSTATIAGAKNWQLEGGGAATDYLAGDIVMFTDSATQTTVEIPVADVSPSQVNFNHSAVDYTLRGNAGIAGSTALIKSGSGRLTIQNANSHTGGTTLSAGTIQLGNPAALGAGTLSLRGGALDLGGQTTSTTISLAGGSLAGTGTLTGTVSGGNLIVDTSGTVTLSTSTSHSGTTTITSGTLALGGAGTLSGGSHSGTISNAGTFAVATSANQTLSGVISGNGTIQKSGSGTLTLSGINTFTGDLTIAGGTLVVGHASALGATTTPTSITSGGTLNLNSKTLDAGETIRVAGTGVAGSAIVGAGTIQGDLILTGDATIGDSGATSLNLGTSAAPRTIQGAYTLTKTGASSKVWFRGTDGGTGNSLAALLINGGTFGIEANNNALGGVPVTVNTGGILSSWAKADGTTPSSQNNPVTLNGGTLGSDFASNTYSGAITLTANSSLGAATSTAGFTISGPIGQSGGSYGLTKNLSNTVVLTGLNTYTGATTILNGTLQIGTGTQTGALLAAGSPVVLGDGTNAGTLTFRLNSDFVFANPVSYPTATGRVLLNMASASQAMTVADATSFTDSTKGLVRVETGVFKLASGADVKVGGLQLVNSTGANAAIRIEEGATLTSRYLNIGGGSAAGGSVVQTGGMVKLEAGDFGIRVGHWASGSTSSTYTITGGTLDATGLATNAAASSKVINVGWDGEGDMTVGGGAGQALVKAYGIQLDANGDSAGYASTLTVSPNGSIEIGAGGLAGASANDGVILNGGSLKASAAGTWSAAMTANTGTSSTLDSNGQNVTVSGAISGAGSLIKTGGGTLTLTGTLSHTGTTTVNAGKLVASSNLSSSALTVAAGAVLGGTGTLGNTTVSGTHSPGNSPGVQSAADLTYTAGSNVLWELIANSTSGRGTNFDGIDVTGNLAFTGATTLVLDFASAGSALRWSDTLWDNDISGTNGWKVFDLGTGTVSGLANLAIGGGPWLDGAGNALAAVRPQAAFLLFQDGNDVYLNYGVSAIPEPAGVLATGLLLGSATLMRRRKR